MKHLIVLIFLGIVIESMVSVAGQRSNNDMEYVNPTAALNADDVTIAAHKRPTSSNFNGRYKKVLKVKKERNQEALPVGKRLNRTPISEDSSVAASANKNSFTVNQFDDNDNDDYFSRRRARFLFRQRVGK